MGACMHSPIPECTSVSNGHLCWGRSPGRGKHSLAQIPAASALTYNVTLDNSALVSVPGGAPSCPPVSKGHQVSRGGLSLKRELVLRIREGCTEGEHCQEEGMSVSLDKLAGPQKSRSTGQAQEQRVEPFRDGQLRGGKSCFSSLSFRGLVHSGHLPE